jgi:hypothetical protein
MISHIGMSELCSRVIENEVDALRIERVCAHQTQQRSRQNEIQWFRRRGGNVMRERDAFYNDQKIDYCADTSVTIAEMTIVYQYCKALKYSGESTGWWCAGGKVKLSQLAPPPDPLWSVVFWMGSGSKHFLANRATCKNNNW